MFRERFEEIVRRCLEVGLFDVAVFDVEGDGLDIKVAKFPNFRRELRNSIREETTYLRGIAHDFNNLLTVIKGHSDLMAEKLDTSSPVYDGLKQIKKSADRASSLTHHLLAFSRTQMLQPKVLDLNTLIADVSKMLPMLIGEDIEFTFRPSKPLSRIKADPSQIKQVILNLAANARDAMPNGGKLVADSGSC